MRTAVFLLLALVLLLLNAFFVLAEFAMVKIRPSRVEELAEKGDLRAVLVKHIQAHLDDYLSLCQVGITFASIGLGFVGEPAIAALIAPLLLGLGDMTAAVTHTISITIAYIVISFLHIVIGELVPKSMALRAADQSALRSARPLRFFHVLFFVPLTLLNSAANVLLRLLGFPPVLHGEHHSEEELRIILNKSQTTGLMPFRRLLMMENVFDLGELKVKDAMRPRELVKALSADVPWEENFKTLRESRLSRLPLIKEGFDKPIGVIHIKDLLYAVQEDPNRLDLERLVRPYHKAGEDVPLEHLLAELQRRRRHLAIVVDKNDKWTGIITMEDIIEEIVGTVEDEFEVEPPIYLSDALTPGRVVLGVEAPDVEEAVRRTVHKIPAPELPLKGDDIVRLVKDRRLTATSFLGEGLCVSHARAEGLDRAVLMFARSDQGITIRGADKTHLLFVLLTPANQPRVQARLLSRISGLFESEYVEQRLREATSPQAVVEAIRAGEAIALG